LRRCDDEEAKLAYIEVLRGDPAHLEALSTARNLDGPRRSDEHVRQVCAALGAAL